MGNELTWTMGRQLASFGNNTYTYNEDGIRTSKTVNGVKTSFLLDGYNIIEQTDGTTTLHFFYDSNGELIGLRYNGNDYFYVKNVMGDIIAITDSNKNIVAEYRYDPWGKVLNEEYLTSIGELNPFRYRSYYYDSDIEMYYLQSRYYDPEVCRFINSDDVNYIGATGTVNSYNAFAYCENNSVNSWDPSGCYVVAFGIEALAAFVVGGYVGLSIAFDNYKRFLISITVGVAIITNAAAFIGGYFMYYPKMQNANDLLGWCVSVGVSYSVGKHISGSGNMDVSPNGNYYNPISVSAGIGVSYPIPYFQTKVGKTFKIYSGSLNTINRKWKKIVAKLSQKMV